MGALEDIKQAIVDLKLEEVGGMVQKALDSGLSALKVTKALSDGLKVVGDLYEKHEYFLSDLYMGAETMNEAMKIVEPLLRAAGTARPGLKKPPRIVIGSVRGDAHDFGKKIVVALMLAEGFEVYDLGVDVSAETFAIEAAKNSADIVGLSTILTGAHAEVSLVVRELEKRDLRDKVKIIQGGTTVFPDSAKRYGIDAAVNSAVDGVNIIKRWMREKRKKEGKRK